MQHKPVIDGSRAVEVAADCVTERGLDPTIESFRKVLGL